VCLSVSVGAKTYFHSSRSLNTTGDRPYDVMQWRSLQEFARLGKGKGSPYSITERRIPVLGSQPAGGVSHKPGGMACSYHRNPQDLRYQFRCRANRGAMGVNSLPKTVTRQRRGCDLNPGPTALECSTLTTRLPSHRDGEPRPNCVVFMIQCAIFLIGW